MFRIYLTEAVKNIKSNFIVSVIIVILLTFLMQLIGSVYAWAYCYLGVFGETEYTIKDESYIEYSSYVLKSKGNGPFEPVIKRKTVTIDPNNPTEMIIKEITEEDIAYNERSVATFEQTSQELKEIEGLIISDKDWTQSFTSEDGKAYSLSLQVNQRSGYNKPKYTEIEISTLTFEEHGYTIEEISNFCDYKCLRYSIDTILTENFTYCEGRGWTEEDLKFDYVISEDGTLPTIPVVMGYDFMEFYDVGDIIKNPYGRVDIENYKKGLYSPQYSISDQHNANFKIIGFLNEDTSVESQSGIRESVDDYIICPFVPNTPEYFPNGEKENQAVYFYSSLLNAQIYIEKENELQIVKKFNDILSQDTVRGIYYYPERLSQVNAVYEQVHEKRVINYALISGSTLIFTVAVIILIIVNKFKSNLKDTAIHRIIGATATNNALCYVFEFLIYLLFADILLHYDYIYHLFSNSYISGFSVTISILNLNVYLIYPTMIVFNIFIISIVAIVAYICSSRLDVATVIKGKE